MMAKRDYYEVLGIERDASEEEIKKMVKDGELHAAEDHKRRETAEARNHLDTLVYQRTTLRIVPEVR